MSVLHPRVVHCGILAATLLTAFSAVSSAQTTPRTTPVEVKSPVAIDQSNNAVKAQQSGAWTVGVTGTPSVSIANTPSVSLAGTPSVSVANTPGVTVTNSPTVKIDTAYNAVVSSSQHAAVPLWNGFQYISASGVLYRTGIDCKGYKEARFFLTTGVSSVDLSKVRVGVNVYTPSGSTRRLGETVFSSSATKYDGQGSFAFATNSCIFTVPVVSDSMDVYVYNGDTIQLTLDGSACWVYLVN